MHRHTVKKFRGLSLFVVAASLAVGVAAAAHADTELRWKFKVGEKTQYEMKSDTTQEMKVGGAPVQIKANNIVNLTWEVTEVAADGTATMKQTVDRMRMEMQLPLPGAGDLKIDSNDEEAAAGAEDMVKSIKAMVGKPFTLKITPLGKVSDFKASDELVASLKAAPQTPMGAAFSEDSLKQMLGQSSVELPAAAVSVGKKWSQTAEMNAPPLGKLVSTTEYSYVGTEERDGKKLEKVDMSVVIKADDNGQIKIKENSGSGAMYWDNSIGRPTELKMDTKTTSEMSIAGQTMTQDTTTKFVMKIVKPEGGREL